MRSRRLTVVVALVAVALAGPLAAAAGADGGGTAYINSDGDPTAAATQAADGPGANGGGGGDSPCTWTVSIEDDFVMHVYETEGVPLYSETGRWLLRSCERLTEDGIVAIDAALLPEGGAVDPAALALEALDSVSVPDPTIGTSPPAGDLVVHVPTWLWVEDSWWHTYTADAQAGRVVSTVTVEPASVTWTTGDGSQVSCSGPGTAWAPGLPEDATDCSHTYTTASDMGDGGRFDLSVAVELNVTWSSNAGPGGTLPTLTRTGDRSVRVGEIQALETG
jgi:hypothetical protein